MWTIEETEEIKQLRHGVMINRWYAIMPSGRFWHLAETKYSDSFINQSHNYSLVWKETPAALATRKFNWVVTISRILNKQAKNPASHTQILASPASRRAVNSRIPSRYLSFSRFLHRILVKAGSREFPSRPWWSSSSYFEQEKSGEKALDEEGQNRWENETVSANRAKTEGKARTNPQNHTHKSRDKS